jgi:hypothetical protein
MSFTSIGAQPVRATASNATINKGRKVVAIVFFLYLLFALVDETTDKYSGEVQGWLTI